MLACTVPMCVPGTAYMHSRGVAHRDLSLENMLVAGDHVGKIIDFGLCVDMPRTALGRFAPVPPGAVGKLFYMAPEVGALRRERRWPPVTSAADGCDAMCRAMRQVYGGRPYWPHLADSWSCGVMLFIMLTGGAWLHTWLHTWLCVCAGVCVCVCVR